MHVVASVPAERVDREYKRQRRSVYAGIFIGYAAYYLVRNNLALAIPDILREHPQYTKADLGWALTGTSISYGISKFLMGSVSDRSNPKYFLPLGLLCSATPSCAVSGAFRRSMPRLCWSSSCRSSMAGSREWAGPVRQDDGAGSAPRSAGASSRSGTLGTMSAAVWSRPAVMGVSLFHDWGAKFYFNAAIAAAIAVVVFFLMRDTPAAYGLPAGGGEHKNDYPPHYGTGEERVFTYREIFVEHVLTNKYLWAIAIASVHLLRPLPGVVNWIPTYPARPRGIQLRSVEHGLGTVRVRRDPGTIACGWMSDTVFSGRRAPATIPFMSLTLLAVIAYWLNLHGPLWIDYVALFSIGFLIYGPIMIIGLHALDLMPKQAAGTAAGVHRFLRLRVRIGDCRIGRRLDRGPLRLDRRVRDDGGVLRVDDCLQCDDARAQSRERGPLDRIPRAEALRHIQ
jgi:OPA family glycerol-3-phosphate transporter-like MFS transporter